MNWVQAAFEALKEFFGWRKVVDDPETIRLKHLRNLDDELAALRKTRDQLLAVKEITNENEEQMAVDMGLVADRIVKLRRARKALER